MFCRNCGNKIQDNERFCPVCGTPVSEPLKKADTSYHRKEHKYVMPLILVLILSLIVIILMIFIVRRELDKKAYDACVQAGKTYMQQENYSDAVEEYENALRIQDSDINIYADLLTAYLALNSPDDAYNVVKKSVENTGDVQLKDSYIYYAYQNILDEYQRAMDKGEDFVTDHSEQFPHTAESLLKIYWEKDAELSDKMDITYYLTDIDQNGTDELAIGISDGTMGFTLDLYAFDGKGAVQLCDTEIDSGNPEALPAVIEIVNNVFLEIKSYVSLENYGTVNIYKLDADGFTPIIIKELQFDYRTAFEGKGIFYDGSKYYRTEDAISEEMKEQGIDIGQKKLFGNEAEYFFTANDFMISIEEPIWEGKEKQTQKDTEIPTEKAEDTEKEDLLVAARMAYGYVYQDRVYYYKEKGPDSFRILAFDGTGTAQFIEKNIHTVGKSEYASYGIIGSGQNLYWMETEENGQLSKGQIVKKNLDTGEKQEIIEAEGLVGFSGILGEDLYYTTYTDKSNWVEIELWELDQSTGNKRQIAAASLHPDIEIYECYSVYDKNTCLVRAMNDNAELSYFNVDLDNGNMQELDISNPSYDNGILYANRKNTDEVISVNMLTGKSESYGIQGQLCCVSDNYIIVQGDNLNELKRFDKETEEIFSLKLQDETLIKNFDNPQIAKQWNINKICSVDNDMLEFCFFETGENASNPYSFKGRYLINPANDNIYIFYGNEFPDNYFMNNERLFYTNSAGEDETYILSEHLAEERWIKIS